MSDTEVAEKPAFNPEQPFTTADTSDVAKPAFDPTQPFEKGGGIEELIGNIPKDLVETGAGIAKTLPGGANMPGGYLSPGTPAEPSGAGTIEGMGKGIVQGAENLFSKEGWVKHPVQNALTVGSALVGGGEKAPAEAPEPIPEVAASEVPPEPAPEVQAPPVNEPAPEAAAPLKPSPTISDYVGKVANAIPSNVQNFVKDKLQGVANKPGWNETLSKYSKEHARNMAMKSLGAAPGQIRKIGIPQAEKLADYALDKGIVGPKTGDIGARVKIEDLHQTSGEAVGSMRDVASQRGAIHDLNSLIDGIRAKLDAKYKSGVNAGERGEYTKALAEVKKAQSNPSASNVANTVTNLFQHARDMDRLKKPGGAYADVARELRSANEGLIASKLTPKELTAYHNALEDFGAATQLKEFAKRKQSTDMGGRLGPGSGISRAALQKGLDTVGYRTEAQIANNISKWLKQNPKATVKPQELFRKYIDEAAEATDEMGPGQ